MNIPSEYAYQAIMNAKVKPIRSLLTAVSLLFVTARAQNHIVTLRELSDISGIKRRVLWKKIKTFPNRWTDKPLLAIHLFKKYERLLRLSRSQTQSIKGIMKRTNMIAPGVSPKTILIYSISKVILKADQRPSGTHLRTLKNLCQFFNVSTTCYYRLKHRLEGMEEITDV